MAALFRLAEVFDDVKQRIQSGPVDRWIWLAMREIANLETEKLTFHVIRDVEGWYAWFMNQVSTSRRADKDYYFLDEGVEDVFKLSEFEEMFELAPIAANRPLELPLTNRQLLARGKLACQFTQHRDRGIGSFYRRLRPLWTSHYDEAMRDMFPSGMTMPPMPIIPMFAGPPPPLTAGAKRPGQELLRMMYEGYVRKYSDGRLSGSSMVILQFMTQLHKALLKNNENRFFDLVEKHSKWDREGWLVLTAKETGLTEKDIKHRESDYQTSIGNMAEPGAYVKDRSEKQRRRQELEKAAEFPRRKKKASDVFYQTDNGKTRDRTGTAYRKDPTQAADMNPALRDEDGGEYDPSDDE